MNLFDVYPINDISIVKAKGSYVWDDNGEQYLDLYGGHAVISIGHTHPHWVKRIEEQLHKIAFYSNSVRIPLQLELAEKLGKISGKEDYQLFLCNSGAEANENALKLASFHNGRKKIIAFSKSFHGRTSLAVSVTDNKNYIAPVNETDNVIFLPFNDEEALEDCFKENGKQISSVIIEGIQGVASKCSSQPEMFGFDMGCYNNTCYRKTITHSFCHSIDVCVYSGKIMTEKFSASAITALYSISNIHGAIFIA